MNNSGKRIVLVLNIVIPILLGVLCYCCFSPEVVFLRKLSDFLGIQSDFRGIRRDGFMFGILRNFVPDMLWAYALVFALVLIIGDQPAALMLAFPVSVIFSAGLECLQLTPIVSGTFDLVDIAVEILSEAAAVFVIRVQILRR